MIDMASVFAERFKGNPQPLQAAVMGQGNVPNLDSYTALRALQLIKESNAAMMAQQARGPVGEQPSLASTAVSPQGLTMPPQMGAPVMGQAQPPQGPPMAQAPQGPPMPQRPPMPPPVMQRSGGLAGLPVSNHGYAPGGIVAFAVGGSGYSDVTGLSGPENVDLNADIYANQSDANTAEGAYGEIKPEDRNSLIQYLLTDLKRSDEVTPVKSADQRKADIKGYREQLEEDSGPDIYGPMKEQLESQEKDRAGTLNQGQGMALLQAAGAMLKGSNFARGAGEAASTYAQAYGQALQADKAEKRSIASMQFNLADAQRKERMGNTRAAMAAEESARKAEADIKRAQNAGYTAKARMAQALLVGTKPPTTKAGAQITPFNAIVAAKRALAADPSNKKLQGDLADVEAAAALTQQRLSISDITGVKAEVARTGAETGQATVQEKINAKVAADMKDYKEGREYNREGLRPIRNAVTSEAKQLAQDNADRLLVAEEARLRKFHSSTESRLNAPPAPARTPAPARAAAPTGANLPPVRIRSNADFDALPSNTLFIDPDGVQRRKP